MRATIGWVVILSTSIYATASDAGAAMLYAHSAFVNGRSVPQSIAIFPGDEVRTPADATANIISLGLQVIMHSDTFLKFDATAISLDHGGLNVTTDRATTTRVGDITIIPLSKVWTAFSVAVSDESVEVVAEKSNLTESDEQGTRTLSPGQHTTRPRSRKRSGATPAGRNSKLDSTPAVIVGAAGVGTLVIWVLTRDSAAISPVKP